MYNFKNDNKEEVDLFEEFSSLNTKQWLNIVEKELKDKSYEELIYTHPSGIEIEPYYDTILENNSPFHISNSLPSQFAWRPVIPYTVQANNYELLKELIIEAINNDNTDFVFTLANDVSLEILKKFLAIILPFQKAGDIFYQFRLTSRNIKLMFPVINRNDNCEVLCDPFLYELNGHINLVKEFPTGFLNGTIVVDTTMYHELGANDALELYIGLQSLMYSLVWQMKSKQHVSRFVWCVSVDTDFFVSMAKMKVARYLAFDLLKQSRFTNVQIEIHTFNSLRSQTTIDPFNNILRSTNSAISAILGSADSVSIFPHDHLTSQPNIDSDRWAYNIHNLLSNESNFDYYDAAMNGCFTFDHIVKNLYKKVLNFGELLTQFTNESPLIAPLSAPKQFLLQQLKFSREENKNALINGDKVIINVNKFATSRDSKPVLPAKVHGIISNPYNYAFQTDEQLYLDFTQDKNSTSS